MASFIEGFLHKADLHTITFEDFKDFYRLKLDESQTLEYKSGELLVGYQGKSVQNGILDTEEANKGFIKLATSVAGFANAQGGLFILGVKEIQVRSRGQVVRKRPGAIYPVPDDLITKEMIESKLRVLIQLPIDDLTILPLRTTKKGNHCIYLIDVPPSMRIPHRVNEADYPQRNIFSTMPMLHYQISDLFGKRFAPSLEPEVMIENAENDGFTLRIVIHNRGRAIAKYPMCLSEVINGPYNLAGWLSQTPKIAQYTPGFNQLQVIYPFIGHAPPLLKLVAEQPPFSGQPTILRCIICAELAPATAYIFQINPTTQHIELLNKQTISG